MTREDSPAGSDPSAVTVETQVAATPDPPDAAPPTTPPSPPAESASTPEPDAATSPRCPSCGADITPGDGFCENCGADLLVRRAEPPDATVPPCPDCGVAEFSDGYCDRCGKLAPTSRDRIERDLGVAAGVTDRGLRHSRNEDAMAFAVLGAHGDQPMSLIAVCDGVSSSTDADRASLVASDAALEHLVAVMRAGGDPRKANAGAIDAAQRAVSELGEAYTDQTTAPSATIVTAVVENDRVTIGWVGDSRAYWLDADPAKSRRLTEDDTWAGQLITSGAVEEAEAYKAPHAHAILRWLGPDAPEEPPHVEQFTPDGPGLVLVCSDGLWNYVWDAADLARLAAGGWGGLAAGAASLTAVALDAGGQDNITVVLAACPPREPAGDAATQTLDLGELHVTEETQPGQERPEGATTPATAAAAPEGDEG